MKTSLPSVGRMIADGLEAVPAARRSESPRTPREAMARGMLDHLLRDRKGRRAFARHVVEIPGEVPSFRTSTRSSSGVFDFLARDHSGTHTTGVLAVKLVVDGPLDQERIRELLAHLPIGDDSARLLLVLPRSRRRELTGRRKPGRSGAVATGSESDPRLLVVTWAQVARRLASRDEERAPLWTALAEFGENGAVDGVRQPAAPKILLKQELATEMRAHLATMLLVSRTLLHRPPRFSSSDRRPGAWLHAGASGNDLGVEFDAVENGSAIWLVGLRPERSLPLRLGALPDEASQAAAAGRLEEITARPQWRSSDDLPVGEFIGVPASRRLEEARALLWDVFDPARLEAAGFPLLPRHQPELTADRLAVRVHAPDIERSGTFLVSIGGSATWRTLLPRVTREFDGRTYVVQAKKSDTAQDLVSAVHEALHSLATKP